jgi:MtN3 and saliva related transmembrane protein
MTLIDLIGFAAGVLTTISFIPQVLRTWRLRSARDVSLGMYAVFTSGLVLWLLYGVLIGSWPIIVANVFTVALTISILVMVIRYR